MHRFIRDILLFCLLVLTVQVIVSLDWKIVRNLETGKATALRIGIPIPYEPAPEIRAVQKYQVEHPELGFLWKPSISERDNVVVAWGDVPAGAITTDDIGFANSKEAVAYRESGQPVDIIGIGASYIGGAQKLFHEYFALNGYSYYSFAHGRFTLPQYNIALEKYALPEKPKWIIYGLNEVSFALIPDFEAWRKTEIGWFEYHSGTWCGPAIKRGFPYDQLRACPRLNNVYLNTMNNFFPKGLGKKPSQKELVQKTERYIIDAWKKTESHGIGFILLLIPSKVRMVQGPSPALYLFDDLVPRLSRAGVPIIDLRDTYKQVEDPSLLYFQQDAHWNQTGVYRAAREILAYIETALPKGKKIE
ncbi:MAG: hypothetical protein GF350_12740 [Chitinivibrionales bacterium]|nr:hypothetical protein [Chitinivibrionales bacterium]